MPIIKFFKNSKRWHTCIFEFQRLPSILHMQLIKAVFPQIIGTHGKMRPWRNVLYRLQNLITAYTGNTKSTNSINAMSIITCVPGTGRGTSVMRISYTSFNSASKISVRHSLAAPIDNINITSSFNYTTLHWLAAAAAASCCHFITSNRQ